MSGKNLTARFIFFSCRNKVSWNDHIRKMERTIDRETEVEIERDLKNAQTYAQINYNNMHLENSYGELSFHVHFIINVKRFLKNL